MNLKLYLKIIKKKPVSLWSRRSEIYIRDTNETNRNKLSSFPTAQEISMKSIFINFRGEIQVETWTCGIADSASEHSPIRKSYPIENEKLAGRKSRFENWRITVGEGERGSRIFLSLSLFFFSSPAKIHFRLSSEREGSKCADNVPV